MEQDDVERPPESRRGSGGPTRREYVKYGSSVLCGGLLAGCAGENGSQSVPAGTPSETTTARDDSYSVTLEPAETVEFDHVPENVYTGLPNTADMAVAAGHGDAIISIYYPEYHGTILNHFYDRLDGVSLTWERLTDSWNLGKEGFYELDSDVHLTDPAYASTLEQLDEADVAEISDEIGPWFGNYYSDKRRDPPQSWADEYRYYSLWEIFERVAQVFRAGSRADALRDVHESMRSTIESNLPPTEERPTVALTFEGKEDTFWVYRLNANGFLTAHTRPLDATDAFADVTFEGAQTQVDYEAMLEADPDVILVLFTMSSSYSISDVREALESSPVGSEIAAVKNDRVYAQGARYQGPIMNLFQLEMTAKQVYPEVFGEWPGYVDGEPYPEIPESEQLFDRQRVADIVNGAI
ncbi:ABC transporter substrate-binding protein [Halogeometricum borinquense]|uniref:ABC transporter substrate-binding protein n=1 Tax=Halogeometricum borinquense TaxID=60847 RepID=UPI003444296D